MSFAVLNPLFFKDYSPTKELFQKWAHLEAWNSSFFPIYEWNDILFVATSLESPPQFHTEKNYVCIKADEKILLDVWGQLQKSEDNFDFSHFEKTSRVDDDTFDISKLSEISQNSSSEIPRFKSHALDEIGDDPFAALSQNVSENQSPTFLTTEDSQGIESVKQDSNPKMSPLPADDSWEEGTGLHPIDNLHQIFDKLNAHFEQSMILLVDGEIAKPWKWNQGYTPASTDVQNISLLEPSPFRVLFRTQKTYQGAVAPNEICNSFAKNWRKGNFPNYMIAAPILIDEKLTAILVGQEPLNSDEKVNLHLIESSANELNELFKSHPDTLIAA